MNLGPPDVFAKHWTTMIQDGRWSNVHVLNVAVLLIVCRGVGEFPSGVVR